jgi:hypothetical protein
MVKMVERQNRGKSPLIGPSYKDQQIKDLIYGILLLLAGVVFIGLVFLN